MSDTEKLLAVLTEGCAGPLALLSARNLTDHGRFANADLAPLAAVSFYAAARLLGGTWLLSCAGAMVFALARYAFAEGLYHLTVIYYWHVPLCLVVTVWLMRGEGIKFGTGRFRFALLVALITGVQHVYYTNLFAQFVLFGGLLQGWRHGWRTAAAVALIGTTAAAKSLSMNVGEIVVAFLPKAIRGCLPSRRK